MDVSVLFLEIVGVGRNRLCSVICHHHMFRLGFQVRVSEAAGVRTS